MRILIIATIYLPLIDGHVRFIHNNAVALAKRNHHVDLVTFKRTRSSDEEVIEGVHIFREKAKRIRHPYAKHFFRLIALVKGILRNYRLHGRADIMYAPGVIPALAALLLRPFLNSKVVISLADLTGMSNDNMFAHRIYRAVCILLVCVSDLTVFPTKFARNLVLGSSKGRYKEVIIPPGTDLHLFTHTDTSEVQEGLILYAGVLRRRKGLDTLIKSFQKIAGRFPHAKLVFVGDGGAKYALQILASKSEFSDRIHFAGQVSDEELTKFHSIASIYVVPTKFDAYATSLVEAMAMGKPVISTRGTAPSEIIQEGKNGLLVKFGDIDDLSETLARLLSSNELAKSLGLEARKRVQKEYDLERSTERMEKEFFRLSSE